MFSRKVVETDRFLDMPGSAQALYFHLGLYADDDGFVAAPTTIQRFVGASKDDLLLLISKGFLIAFDTGVIVITHWRVSNTIQNDRYKPTINAKEKRMLTVDASGKYTLEESMDPTWIQNGSNTDPKWIPNITKDNITKDNKTKTELNVDISTVKEVYSKNNISTGISSERLKIAAEPQAPVEAITLNDGMEWRPSQKDYEEYIRLFPAVDIDQQFRNMRSWCNNNPTRRKTRRGVKRFVNSWLCSEQDKASRRRRPEAPQEDDVLRRIIENDG